MVSGLNEPTRSKAKSWFKKFFTTGNALFRELQINQSSISEDVEYTHDELEEYLIFIVNNALDVPVEKINDYIKHINSFNNEN
jgi:hypothetical protein